MTLKEYIKTKTDTSKFAEQREEKILEGLADAISTAINIAILEKLDDASKKEFLALVQAGTSEEIPRYAESKIGDFTSLLDDAADKTIDEYNRLVGEKEAS